MDPKDTVSLCMLGYTFEKMGKEEEALKYYGEALKLNPNDPLASRLMAGVDLHD